MNITIRKRTRSLGYGSTSTPGANPALRVGGLSPAGVRRCLAVDRKYYGNHEGGQGHSGTAWVASLFYQGLLVQTGPNGVAGVLDDLDLLGEVTVHVF